VDKPEKSLRCKRLTARPTPGTDLFVSRKNWMPRSLKEYGRRSASTAGKAIAARLFGWQKGEGAEAAC
jgi:phytoene/squalene synthetase